jgi:Domain of unknown function (DUF1707)
MVFDPRWVIPPGGHGQMRASTADRESAIEILKSGFTEGRLTLEEYEERVGQAYGSRTYNDLARLTWDLPVASPGGILPQGAGYLARPAQPRVNGLAVASLAFAFIPGLLSVLAVILGMAARIEIRERGGRGLALANAGIAIGVLASLVFAIWMLG